MNNITINILTRTSGRPNGFLKCYTSVYQQTYKSIRHIVSIENDSYFPSYLMDLDIEIIKVTKASYEENYGDMDKEGNKLAPYNLYCNDLLDKVKDGWILFLDDDDNMLHNKVIEELVETIRFYNSNDILFIWQMRYPDGRVLPTDILIKNKILKKNKVGSPCFLFHSKYKNLARWDSYKASDFRFLIQLHKIIPSHIWLKKVYIQINNNGDLGERNDISYNSRKLLRMPIIYYKNFIWHIIPKYHLKVYGRLLFHKKTYKKKIIRLFYSKWFEFLKRKLL